MTNKRYNIISWEYAIVEDSKTDKAFAFDKAVDMLNEKDETIERYQFMIKDALSRERTQLGQSVLRQLADALEIEI